MQEQSTLKKIFNIIKKYLLIIFLAIGGFFQSLFGSSKKEVKKVKIDINNNQNNKKEINKKETPITTTTSTTLPDDDNIKVNPHNNIKPTDEDTSNNTDVVLELPKQKLYKVYTKDNELKYLPLDALLDLIIKEELERIYKVENFKLKTATTREIIKVEQIKERILPEIISRVEKEVLRNAEVIREEVIIKLEIDLEKNPLFRPRPKVEIKEDIYSIGRPKKKPITLNKNTTPKVSTENKQTIKEEQKLSVDSKLETMPIVMIKNTEEIPEPTITDNIKDVALLGAMTIAAATEELLTPSKENTPSTIELQELKTPNDIPKEEQSITTKDEEIKNQQDELPKEEKQLIEEIKEIKTKDKTELEELKRQVEEKIEEIKQEEKKKETIETEINQDKRREEEIVAIAEISEQVLGDTKDELKKDDFFEKDYDKIERQIDKMLEDLSNTYLKYEDRLTEKQKKKLKAEEQRLRQTKEDIKSQKRIDIEKEQFHLDETIKSTEIKGLENELENIHKENEKEVSNDLLGKMQRLEGMTAEQVANVDKRILLKRFNKANILLEMTSLLALPFVRNKYFFYFTVGLVIDNHFNFVNAFFNRKYNKYDPVDLSQIQKGQDALNGALDITYKNLVELEYLEQRALTRYPELKYDPRFIHQVTSLRTNLNKKYNNLMRKNNIMEKYRMKTKKHIRILKPELKKKKQQEQEAA